MSDSKCFFCRGSVKGWPTMVYRRNMGRSLLDVNQKNMDLLKMTLFTSLMFLFIFPKVITLMFFFLLSLSLKSTFSNHDQSFITQPRHERNTGHKQP